ncbi:MAG: bifunctional folylpolyglutamate synthase/dihydrofolate synthase [Verrucomicrobiota bacterium]|nr:bifunctional folylpolyglutamate synthase/dihydrofolate synthase [Verrucomicrobiota bacterium]
MNASAASMPYREALAWLYATQMHGIKLGLKNTERLLRDLAITFPPHVIHVAGTNGKGSVCALTDAICRAAGQRTGLFTSPHLVTFRERIRVNGEMIGEENVARGLTAIRALVANWDPHPTFFEITTALALRHFQKQRCQVIVLETGLGGRLDSTNAAPASVSVLTPIDFDHEKWLGSTLAQIATEKAGIIKPGVPMVSAPQLSRAEAVIRRRAEQVGAPCAFVTEEWDAPPIALRGKHQRCNAALAVAALRASTIPITDDAIARGLAEAEWPARFQLWNERIVIDGAHNPSGAETLARVWQEEFGDERASIVLAILHDKNAAAIIQALAPIAARFYLPKIKSERAIIPRALAAMIKREQNEIFPTTADALTAAEKQKERILITGSLHFAGEVLAHLRGEPQAHEDCAQ